MNDDLESAMSLSNRSCFRVVLVGVQSWCEHLRSELEAVSQLEVVTCSPSAVVGLKRYSGDVVVRVGMRPGARTVRGRVFDWSWRRAVPLDRRVTYWIGTDVYDTTHDVERHDLEVDYLGGIHLAGAPWLTDELRRIGIQAETALFPTTTDDSEPVVDLPQEFVVHAYVPELKPDFYGRRIIEELARRRPATRFEVWGSDRTSDTDNLTYRGRTDDMRRVLDDAVVHLRLTRHDALAATVRESLSRGRYVLFPYQYPGVIQVSPWDIDRIELELDSLATQFSEGELGLNEIGRIAVQPLMNESAARQLAERLMGVAQAASR
jgi:hypothetical protein